MLPNELRNFMKHVIIEPESQHWVWYGYLDKGVPKTTCDQSCQTAWRASYLHFVGPVLYKHIVSPKCGERKCVNPQHMQMMTYREKMRTSTLPWATTIVTNRCKRGHEFNISNTRMMQGRRSCQVCQLRHQITSRVNDGDFKDFLDGLNRIRTKKYVEQLNILRIENGLPPLPGMPEKPSKTSFPG